MDSKIGGPRSHNHNTTAGVWSPLLNPIIREGFDQRSYTGARTVYNLSQAKKPFVKIDHFCICFMGVKT